MKTLNKIYFVVDIDMAKNKGFNRAIVSRPYETITVPREKCALKNRLAGCYKYAVAEIPLIDAGIKYKNFTFIYDEEKRMNLITEVPFDENS